MTHEADELVKKLRAIRLQDGGVSLSDLQAIIDAAATIESLQAAYQSACTRAEEAEARALFFETEMERILKEGARK